MLDVEPDPRRSSCRDASYDEASSGAKFRVAARDWPTAEPGAIEGAGRLPAQLRSVIARNVSLGVIR